MSDELREIVDATQRQPGFGATDAEERAYEEAWEVFESTFSPERVSKMLDVIEAARKVVDSAIEPEGYGLTRPLADALAALDSATQHEKERRT